MDRHQEPAAVSQRLPESVERSELFRQRAGCILCASVSHRGRWLVAGTEDFTLLSVGFFASLTGWTAHILSDDGSQLGLCGAPAACPEEIRQK